MNLSQTVTLPPKILSILWIFITLSGLKRLDLHCLTNFSQTDFNDSVVGVCRIRVGQIASNSSLGVDNVDSWPRVQSPLFCDLLSAESIRKASPVNFVFRHCFFCILKAVAVNTNKGKRIVLELLYERPPVRISFYARRSPIGPKVQ